MPHSWIRIAVATALCIGAYVAEATDFAVGQVWSYQTRSGEEQSTLTVVKIDQIGDETIVHISVEKLRLRSPTIKVVGSIIGHLPFSEKALRGSVVKMLRFATTLPDFQGGYDV